MNGREIPEGDTPPQPHTFPKSHLSSVPELGAQTHVRCYQHRQPLDHVQKHFILLALKKTGDLEAKRPGTGRKDRPGEARTLGWGHRVGKGLSMSRNTRILLSGIPEKNQGL